MLSHNGPPLRLVLGSVGTEIVYERFYLGLNNPEIPQKYY